jgi:hypothetical protein
MEEEGIPEVVGRVYSMAPTLLPGTVPPQDKGRWEAVEETESNSEWSQEAWRRTSSVVVCVAAAKDGSTVKLEQMIDKAIATATAGLRVAIVAEMPEKKEGRHAVSFEPPTGQWVDATNIMVIPPGRVPWKVGMEWSRDPDGNLCSTSRERSKEAAPRGFEEMGRNTRSLMVWLYSAKVDEMAGVISSQQLSELARILASTSGAMKMQGDIPVRWRNRGDKQWIDLALHSFDSTEDFDALEGLKASQEEESSEEQERLADGVAPACLTRFFKTHGLKADEARAASAAVTAGCMNDVAEIYEPMVTAQAQALCASLGESIGRTQRWQQGSMQYCDCCAAMVTQTWSLPKEHGDTEIQQTIIDARAKRTKRIMEEELNFWRPVPLTEAEVETKRRTEATTQGNDNRDARAAKRSGEGQQGAGEVEPTPIGDGQVDVDYGPEEVREAIQAVVNSEGMHVCATCVAPSMWAKRQHSMSGNASGVGEALMWAEVCALAQGISEARRGIKRFQPQKGWKQRDVFQREDSERLMGQEVVETNSDVHRRGKIVPVARIEGVLHAYVHIKGGGKTSGGVIERWEWPRVRKGCSGYDREQEGKRRAEEMKRDAKRRSKGSSEGARTQEIRDAAASQDEQQQRSCKEDDEGISDKEANGTILSREAELRAGLLKARQEQRTDKRELTKVVKDGGTGGGKKWVAINVDVVGGKKKAGDQLMRKRVTTGTTRMATVLRESEG